MNVEPVTLPPEKRAFLKTILDELHPVTGLSAVVLGGSYARGTQRPDSDMDIGLYYAEAAPFSIDDIRQVARKISTANPPTVTTFYEWGHWVNGGAWMHTPVGKVDFLYRNIDQVRAVIADAHIGKIDLDYLQQPPYGFPSVIYLGETSVCLPLVDPQGILGDLKKRVVPYPALLKQTIVQEFLWGTEFTLSFAQDFARKEDIYATAGCLTRALSYLTQVLFAVNETYFISDKNALHIIETFARKPADYEARVRHILGGPGYTAQELSNTVRTLRGLFDEVARTAQPWYQPKYRQRRQD